MSGKIKAITLSGGGDKGAFTVGVLEKLLSLGNDYEIISGTSTGALIAPFLAAGELEVAKKVYTTIGKSDVLTARPNAASWYSVSPLRKLLSQNLTDSIYQKLMDSEKRIFLSTVCLNNKQITYWTGSGGIPGRGKYDVSVWKDREELIKCIMASSVQPVLMPLEQLQGNYYADGGLREFLPIEIAIDAGAEHITGIMTTTGKRHYKPGTFSWAPDILLKTIEIFSSDVSQNDVRLAEIYNSGIRYIEECRQRVQRSSGLAPDVVESLFTSALNPFFGKRLISLEIIRPQIELGGGLDFNTEWMNFMYRLGLNTVF